MIHEGKVENEAFLSVASSVILLHALEPDAALKGCWPTASLLEASATLYGRTKPLRFGAYLVSAKGERIDEYDSVTRDNRLLTINDWIVD